jgi:DNA repair protein RecO (recombination protein O)
MSAEKATAFVLRVIEFSESSSVVTLFTREFGKVSGLAKGARKPKGPFESALDLLSLCRVVFLRKTSGALDLLTEAKLDRRFRPFGRDLTRLYASYYIAELLNDLSDEYDPHPELFDVADETLFALSREEHGLPMAWVVRFELALLRNVGHLPSLTVCAECGEELAPTKRVSFAMLDGGVMCPKCRTGKRQLVSIRSEVLVTLQTLADSSENGFEDWKQLTIATDERGEIRKVLNQYFANLLGEKPRMMAFLGMMKEKAEVKGQGTEVGKETSGKESAAENSVMGAVERESADRAKIGLEINEQQNEQELDNE